MPRLNLNLSEQNMTCFESVVDRAQVIKELRNLADSIEIGDALIHKVVTYRVASAAEFSITGFDVQVRERSDSGYADKATSITTPASAAPGQGCAHCHEKPAVTIGGWCQDCASEFQRNHPPISVVGAPARIG